MREQQKIIIENNIPESSPKVGTEIIIGVSVALITALLITILKGKK